jgi:uncharacterized iron-regulated protein
MHKGVIYGLKTALPMMSAYRVLFLGEEHGVPESHAAELALFSALAALDPKMVLALEMF